MRTITNRPQGGSYQAMLTVLNGRTIRKVGNNTYAHVVHLPDGREGIAVRLHTTDIITYWSDNETFTLDTGGWYTSTTLNRMNAWMPAGYSAYRRQGRVFVWNRRSGGHYELWDGDTFPVEA